MDNLALKTPVMDMARYIADTKTDERAQAQSIINLHSIKDVDKINNAIKFWRNEKTLSGANLEEINKRLTNLFLIYDRLIDITMGTLAIKGETSPFVSDTISKSEGEDHQDRIPDSTVIGDKSPARKVEKKTIDATKQFIKKAQEDASKVSEIKDWFKGYTRRVVFGTAIELPKTVQDLLPHCDTESKIDEIAYRMLDEDRAEDALNLSIDLFLKTGLKLQSEVEKRFLFVILPYVNGVTVEPKKNMENITLSMWVGQLKEKAETISELEKSSTDDIKILVLDFQTNKYLSIKSQILLDKYAIDQVLLSSILGDIAKQCNIKIEDLVYQAVNQTDVDMLAAANKKSIIISSSETVVEEKPAVDNVEEVKIVGMAFETLQNECVRMLGDKIPYSDVHKHFEDSVSLITDKTEKEKKHSKELWAKIQNTYKKAAKTGPATPKETTIVPEATIDPKEKEKIVAEAEAAAVEGKDKLPEKVEDVKPLLTKDELKTASRNAFQEALKVGKTGLNALREWASAKFIRDSLNEHGIKAEELYKEIKAETSDAPATTIKTIDFTKEHVDLYKLATECKTLPDFANLIKSIVFEKKLWMIAYSLTHQYIQNFEEFKTVTDEVKTTWFRDLTKKPEATKVETPSTETSKKEGTKQNPEDLIPIETDNKRIKLLVAELILSGLAIDKNITAIKDDIKLIMRKNKFYAKSKDKELDNTIANVIKNNPEIQQLIQPAIA